MQATSDAHNQAKHISMNDQCDMMQGTKVKREIEYESRDQAQTTRYVSRFEHPALHPRLHPEGFHQDPANKINSKTFVVKFKN